MEDLGNQRIAEYFIISMILAIGLPVCIVWGFRDGESLVAKAHAIKAPPAAATPAADRTGMFMPTPENIEKGRGIFQQNCTPCHGENADGKGQAAIALTPPPRNFLDPKARWTRSRDPGDIFKTISEGSPGTAMPPFSASLKEEELWELTHFLGTLPGVRNQFQPIDADRAKAFAEGKKP